MIAPVGAGDTPTGVCRLGGAALLEPDTPWPEIDGVPLSLLAVLDVGALGSWAGGELGTGTGLLNFFHVLPYVDREQDDGIDAFNDPRAWRVVPAGTERAVETSAPAAAYVFGHRPAWTDPVLTLPAHEESVVASLDLGPGTSHRFPTVEAYDIRTTWPTGADDRAHGHRAFGWPSRGCRAGGRPERGRRSRTGGEEVQLLELGSDEEFQWGDGGILHYLVPAEELGAGDFSRVRVEYSE